MTGITQNRSATKPRSHRIWIAVWLLLLGWPLTETEIRAQQAHPATATNTVRAGAKILRESLNFYAGLKSFTCDVKFGFTLDQEGLSASATEDYCVALQRPKSLAVVFKNGPPMLSPEGSALVCDGSRVYSYLASPNKYSISPAPATLSEAGFDELDHAQKGPTPYPYLKPLVSAGHCDILTDAQNQAQFVADEDLQGIPCRHIQFNGSKGLIDIWIERGNAPLIRKIVHDVSAIIPQLPWFEESMRGTKMKLVVQYLNWKINPALGADQFRFSPPPGAQLSESLHRTREEKAPTPLLGKPAPPFKVDLLSGGQFDLASHKGKHIVVLEFWATWSVPSTRALPEVARITSSYTDKGVVFCAINQGQKPEVVKAFLAQVKPVPNVAIEHAPNISTELYQVETAPLFVIIDKEGIVRFSNGDYRSPFDLEQRLKELTVGKAGFASGKL